jgi:hypothetical protein
MRNEHDFSEPTKLSAQKASRGVLLLPYCLKSLVIGKFPSRRAGAGQRFRLVGKLPFGYYARTRHIQGFGKQIDA